MLGKTLPTVDALPRTNLPEAKSHEEQCFLSTSVFFLLTSQISALPINHHVNLMCCVLNYVQLCCHMKQLWNKLAGFDCIEICFMPIASYNLEMVAISLSLPNPNVGHNV